MAVYFITGKLGSGKTLQAVSLMRRYIVEGKPVCTNIDLNMKYLVGSKATKVRAFRIPDRPTSDDLLAVGRGNFTKDETQNGAMVLDECGIWFNSRNWNAAGRQDIINFMLMVRKMGWDVYFLVQNISVIDKQARDTLAEFVVYCTALSKLKVPVLSSFWRFFTGSNLPLPKMHHAVVRYGTSHYGMKADSWWYMGQDLFSAYNTQQIFLTENLHPEPGQKISLEQAEQIQGVYSVIPPIYYHGYAAASFTNLRNIMRLTKILLRKYNRFQLVAAGCLIGAFAQSFWNLTDTGSIRDAVSVDQSKPALEQFSGYTVDSYSQLPGRPPTYVISNGDLRYSSDALIDSGIHVYSIDECALQLKQGDETLNLKCKGVL